MKRFLIPSLLLILLSCNNEASQTSAFDDIHAQAPYAALTDSIKKDKKRSDLYFQRAILLNKNNLPEPALADFEQAWTLEKKEPYAMGISNILLDKKPGLAVTFIQSALKDLPQSLFLQLILARAYDAENKPEDALAVCNRILQAEPNQVNALVLKSEILERKNDLPGLVASLEKAYALLPGNREISQKLAYQYAETKNAKAITLADSLISKDSLHQFPEPYYIKGNYYANINDKANAIRFYDETIRHDHRYLNAYIEKGKILLDQKKNAEALKTFQLANTISPAFADAWYWIGQCLEKAGAKEEAKSSYEKAYGLDKTFVLAKEAADRIK